MVIDQEKGAGEAAERVIQKRWQKLIIVSLILGAISGVLIAFANEGSEAGLLGSAMPVSLAALLSASWLATMIYGAWYYETQVDEVERNANYYGYAVGGGFVLILYPVWYMLWWAGVLPEPSHEVLMGMLLIAACAGYAWKKYR